MSSNSTFKLQQGQLAVKPASVTGQLPARTCIGVTGLAYDALVEIDMVARRPGADNPT
jgi:enamine deaminase RidA (YjgF/YER057c/UK114 family)